MKKMKEVLEKVYTNKSLRSSIVPLFIGNPGLGKTVILKEFAKEKGINIVEFITSQRNPFEISGMAMPDRDLKKMSIWDFDDMLKLKDGDILFFDEVLNGNPVVLNACLTLLESRTMISGKKLPDIMVVAAANHQGMVPLTPQIKERFVWYNVEFDRDMWKDYMAVKYRMPRMMSNKLCDLIVKEDFKSNNFYSPRSVDKAVNMIIHEVPSPYMDTVGSIINAPKKNPFKKPVVLSDDYTLQPEEMISWAKLMKFKYDQLAAAAAVIPLNDVIKEENTKKVPVKRKTRVVKKKTTATKNKKDGITSK